MDEAKWLVPPVSLKALNIGDSLQDLLQFKSFKLIKSYYDYVLGFLCFCDIWPHMWWEICAQALSNVSLSLSLLLSHTDTIKKIHLYLWFFLFFILFLLGKITNTVALKQTTNNSCIETTDRDEVELKQARRMLRWTGIKLCREDFLVAHMTSANDIGGSEDACCLGETSFIHPAVAELKYVSAKL